MTKKWFVREEEAFDPRPENTDDFPTVPYRVLHAGIPFFSDAGCQNRVEGATIAILRPLDPDHQMGDLDVVPCLKEYQAGQLLGWALNHKQVWEDSWYRDPDDGEIRMAWTTHVEFNGAVISPAAVEANREKLEEIERRLAEQEQSPEKPSVH